MDRAGFEASITEISAKIAEREKLELVAVEVAGTSRNLTVRIFIDKPGGVTIEECATVSRNVGDKLDEVDLIPAAYTLEVSSPGLDRPLLKLEDFERFKGNLAKVRTHQPIEGQRNFKGRIDGISGEEVILSDKTTGTVRIPFSAVAKANLEVDLEAELNRKR